VKLAVVGLSEYGAQSGVGRTLHSLLEHWRGALEVRGAHLVRPPLPLLRAFPTAVRAPAGSSLVLLPQLTNAQALRRTGGLPSLAIVHDVGIMDFPGDREGRSALAHALVRRSFQGLRHASHIVTVSEFSRERLLHHAPGLRAKVTAIPSGVSETFLSYARSQGAARREIGKALGGELGSPLLLYVGSEIGRKNLSLLLDTFCRVRARFPKAHLLKVGGAGGEGWRKRTLELLRARGLCLGRDVLLAEAVSDARLADFYGAADVFVSASLYEGFGLPALEAMAVGTPAVVTDRGSFPEITRGAGRAAPPKAASLAGAVFAALEDRGEARNRAWARHFTWERTAARYLELMHTLAETPHPAAPARATARTP